MCISVTIYDLLRDFSGPFTYLVQDIILALTAWYALRAIRENRANAENQNAHHETIARRRATLDIIFDMNADKIYAEAKTVVNKMRREGVDPAHLRAAIKYKGGDPESRKQAASDFKACQIVLNKLELIASGINAGVLDDDTFKKYYFSTFVLQVEFLTHFISEFRRAIEEDSSASKSIMAATIYQECVDLFQRWKAAPLIVRSRTSNS